MLRPAAAFDVEKKVQNLEQPSNSFVKSKDWCAKYKPSNLLIGFVWTCNLKEMTHSENSAEKKSGTYSEPLGLRLEPCIALGYSMEVSVDRSSVTVP